MELSGWGGMSIDVHWKVFPFPLSHSDNCVYENYEDTFLYKEWIRNLL